MGKVKHGHNCVGKRSSEYCSWIHMIQRCENRNVINYKDYGGRGIKVCERWHDFRNFFADMGHRPEGLTLERLDNDGNYEKSNCVWATRKEQAINKRIRKDQYWFYGYGLNGEMIIENNQNCIARILGLNQRHISNCLYGKRKTHKGWRFQWI